MNDPSVRKDKTGDQLKPGDWIAPGVLLDGAAEVLFALPYPGSGGTHVQLVVREQAAVVPYTDVIGGNTLLALASEADLAELKAAAERTQKIANIRALATFLEANPDFPMTEYMVDQTDVRGPEGLAVVRALGRRLGVKVDDSLDDRTSLQIVTGHHHHKLIAWHEDGRPAEPAPEPAADPTDLGASFDSSQMADADATPVPTSRRYEPHFADGNTGVDLVDESERPLVSAATIAEVAAMEVRDREAGGPPWEVPDHPDNAQPGGWHRGQIR